MKIFLIEPDTEIYKFYVLDAQDPLTDNILSFDGQTLKNAWKPFRVNIFNGKTKIEKIVGKTLMPHALMLVCCM